MSDSELDILVVDDARFSAAVVNRTLATAGYTRIRHAHSAQDALGQLTEQPADLVVADWLMPGMDGLELTRRIRQNDEASNPLRRGVLHIGGGGCPVAMGSPPPGAHRRGPHKPANPCSRFDWVCCPG